MADDPAHATKEERETRRRRSRWRKWKWASLPPSFSSLLSPLPNDYRQSPFIALSPFFFGGEGLSRTLYLYTNYLAREAPSPSIVARSSLLHRLHVRHRHSAAANREERTVILSAAFSHVAFVRSCGGKILSEQPPFSSYTFACLLLYLSLNRVLTLFSFSRYFNLRP